MKLITKMGFAAILAFTGLCIYAQTANYTQTIDEYGNYFIQDFEDASTYPLQQSTEEQSFIIEGQGEWLYKGTYQSTNTSYNVNGSTANLRLPKNGGYYVITPVLKNGVGSVSFYLGRAIVTLWTSTDGGNTWQNIGTANSKGVVNTIQIESLEVNRIKISNEASKDADIDNLTVTAQSFGTLASVQTDSAFNITHNSAMVSGTILDAGSQAITDSGILWSTTNTNPSLSDRIAKSTSTDNPHFEVQLTRLRASQTVYYRAFARSSAGYAYGEVKSFTTLEKPEGDDDGDDADVVGNTIWCSPDGDDTTADGSSKYPFFVLQKAIDIAEPGDRIWMKAGTYVYDKRINIDDRNGTEEAPIELFAYGGRAILDFSAQPYHKHSDNPYQGVRLTSSYWHFYRIDIRNASDNGMLIERNKPTGGSSSDINARTQDAHDNIIEQCNFYKNGDTGLQIKNLGSYNYIINCDAYENADEDDGDADGFAPKISVGDGNYFFGCRAWNNSDDGYDVFFKKEGGFEDNKTIIMEYCLAYQNGIMNGSATSGNGNGFKMGSDQGRMNCILNRCLAVENLNKGFDQNHNSGDIIMNNCTGVGQTRFGGKSYSYRIYEELASGSICEIRNSIAINDRLKTGDDGKKGEWGRFEVTVASKEEQNDWKCAPANFIDMTHSEQLIEARQADGSLPEIMYAHISETEGQALIDAGVKIDADESKYAAASITVPAIEYAGEAPDLGAYESGFLLKNATLPVELKNSSASDESAIHQVTMQKSNHVSIKRAQGNLFIVALKEANANDAYSLCIYTADGKRVTARQFYKATILNTQQMSGTFILQIEGKNLKESVKINL